MKKLDLSLGNPTYLDSYWEWASEKQLERPSLPLQSYTAYGPAGGLAELKEKILKLHDLVGNAETKDRYVVIGHGVTQLINGAISQFPADFVYAKAPYFFRFPKIFYDRGIIQIQEDEILPSGNFVELVTTPSNPENKLFPMTNAKWKVFDLCYNWPQYGEVNKHDENIMLFGLAKSTGHAGTKIGWALVNNKSEYDSLCEHIDISTGGVSIDAQMKAIEVIDFIISQYESKARHGSHPSSETPFEAGYQVLTDRWKRLLAINSPKVKFLNSSGMFAWIEIEHSSDAARELEAIYGVIGRDGPSCGGEDFHVRLNVGCSDLEFEDLINRLT
jgi:L-tryptophan--pyruvate aminotransferase